MNDKNVKDLAKRKEYGLGVFFCVCLIVSLYLSWKHAYNANTDVNFDTISTISTVEEQQRQIGDGIGRVSNRINETQNTLAESRKTIERVQNVVESMQTTIGQCPQSIDVIERRINECQNIVENNRTIFSDIEKTNRIGTQTSN